MADLSNLVQIFIDDNRFTGNPTSILQELTNLDAVFVDGNNFKGDIDGLFLSEHPKLVAVDISHNEFTSSNGLPSHLLSMPSLKVLDLSANRLSGNLPSLIMENTMLKIFSIYKNGMEGEIPTDIKNLKSLVHLDLSDNELTGPIRSEIGEMMSLSFLVLSNNPHLDGGGIPESFVNLTILEDLSLRNTNRTGPLPEYLGEMEKLVLLDLGSNQLSGAIPDSWGKLTDLEFLLLNDNGGINGHIPKTLQNMTTLRAGLLDGTSLEGSFETLCELPLFRDMDENEVLYADCGGNSPSVTCDCCKCCDVGNETGCSQPFLSNWDVSWKNYFQPIAFQFTNDTY
jgi:Leucine-rich repeat (LRR) protein